MQNPHWTWLNGTLLLKNKTKQGYLIKDGNLVSLPNVILLDNRAKPEMQTLTKPNQSN